VTTPLSRSKVQAVKVLDPRLVLRWEYVGRLATSLTIFLAVGFLLTESSAEDRLTSVMLLVAAVIFTAVSAAWSEFPRRPVTDAFVGAQILFDLLLVTGLVHVTGGATSQFAALYILVIAAAALLLTVSAGLLVAALGCVLYFADVILGHQASLGLGHWLQLGVFAGVALSSGYIASRLREARAGHEELAAELVKVRLQAADILRNIRSGIVTVDGSGNLVYANPAASALLGVNLDAAVGQPVDRVVGSISPELVTALRNAVQLGIRTTRAEGRAATTSRTFPIGLNTTVSTLDQGDAAESRDVVATATAIFQDISDQKRLDMLHRRTQRLEAVTELSASLAHEIKNPLASIRSAVEQIGQSKHATPDEQTLTSLIVKESDRLSRLLSEFLDFARVRVSRVETLDVAGLVRGAALLAGANPDRPEGVQVRIETRPDAGSLDGDEDVLHRAIFNLVLNAVQASPPGGMVHVETAGLVSADAPPGVRLDGGGVVIRIQDHGPGIAPDVRERMFDPFFTTRPEGSGLGLAVVHRAVESHAGYVFVDSEEGSGTRMTVLLPRRHDQRGEAA
jgi:two-component system sensor histidine kinase PilS (NtrC family)